MAQVHRLPPRHSRAGGNPVGRNEWRHGMRSLVRSSCIGTQNLAPRLRSWMPACAGMTARCLWASRRSRIPRRCAPLLPGYEDRSCSPEGAPRNPGKPTARHRATAPTPSFPRRRESSRAKRVALRCAFARAFLVHRNVESRTATSILDARLCGHDGEAPLGAGGIRVTAAGRSPR